jgi:hypothetical protein
MSRTIQRLLISCFFVLILGPIIVFGQNTAELCRAFVDNAFRDLGNNCANLDSNELCYGFGNFGEVTTTFYVDGETQVVREDIFANPADRISLIEQGLLQTVESISTEEFFLDRDNDNVDENRWGVAVQEVRANLPKQLDQNTAIFVLFGGARIENGVFPEDALILLDEPIEVIANANAPLFGSPEGLGYTVPSIQVGTASGNLEADGISPDGAWLRVFFLYERDFGERATAWVRVADLDETEGIDTLPVIGPDTYTPMQKLFLTNIFNDPVCNDVPAPGLLVQGPDAIETDFLVNNLPIRVTSTAFIEQISARRMRVTAVSGITLLFPDTGGQEVIPTGFSRVVCLTEEQDLGIDSLENDRSIDSNCPEGGPDVLGRGEFGILDSFTGLPGNILNYGLAGIGLACPSGVGAPPCTIQLPPNAAAHIQQLCAQVKIPANVCSKFGF